MTKKWELPLYEYKLPSRKIVVNVTRSCPVFTDQTPGVEDVASSLHNGGRTRILDFGAGKLRNTLYLLSLKVGFRVTAVEFKECFETPAGTRRLDEANRYGGFFLKTWPHEFLQSPFEVDGVLLINVANVIPEAKDRRRVVRECTARLRKGGWFLWMSQYGEPHYKPGVTRRLRAPDGGWFYSLDNKHQTYYREITVPEIKTYFPPSTYRELRPIRAAHHHAFLFEKVR